MRRLTIYTSIALLCLCQAVGNAVPQDNANEKGTAARTKKSDDMSPRISSNVDVAPNRKLTDSESREVAFAAGRILKHAREQHQCS